MTVGLRGVRGRMAGWVSSEEEWRPAHSKPWFRDAMKDARNAGWWFMKFEDHGYGSVCCDPEIADRCKFDILSTGKGGESAAKDLRKDIRNCPHRGQRREPAGAQRHLLAARASIEHAESLLDCVDRLLLRGELSDEAAAVLADALRNADEAEQALQLEEAAGLEDGAETALADAREYALEAGHPGAEMHPAPVLDLAAGAALTARKRLAHVPNRPEKRELQQRLEDVRDRIALLDGPVRRVRTGS